VLLYAFVCSSAYSEGRFWVPFALPALGTLTTHLGLLGWLVTFEQSEKRRVRAVFSKMVPPSVVSELLAQESLALGGTKVEVTVFFADVRGFTELTVNSQKEALARVRAENLSEAAAQACFEEHAVEVLSTVNAYLDAIARVVRDHEGTLDKFIGDCVMAYWGAPKPVPRNAAVCVRAAIQAQRAIEELNRNRQAENHRRAQKGQKGPGCNPLPLLSLGSGINTGYALAGLMGSAEAESLSYTVFGREVNLASRLESASGHGRIFISETTYQHLVRDDPALAQLCARRKPVPLKGFDEPVPVFEVDWRDSNASPRPCELGRPA
jgi:adenylate cyclase